MLSVLTKSIYIVSFWIYGINVPPPPPEKMRLQLQLWLPLFSVLIDSVMSAMCTEAEYILWALLPKTLFSWKDWLYALHRCSSRCFFQAVLYKTYRYVRSHFASSFCHISGYFAAGFFIVTVNSSTPYRPIAKVVIAESHQLTASWKFSYFLTVV